MRRFSSWRPITTTFVSTEDFSDEVRGAEQDTGLALSPEHIRNARPRGRILTGTNWTLAGRLPQDPSSEEESQGPGEEGKGRWGWALRAWEGPRGGDGPSGRAPWGVSAESHTVGTPAWGAARGLISAAGCGACRKPGLCYQGMCTHVCACVRACVCVCVCVKSDCLRPHGLWPTRLLCPWDSPGKNTAVGHHALLQGIFPTQG